MERPSVYPYLDFDPDPEEQNTTEESSWPIADSAIFYQREVRKLPVTTQAESQILADKIQKGVHAELHIDILRLEEGNEEIVKELEETIDAAKKAHWELVVGNLRLAAHVARLTMGWVPFGYDPVKKNGESVFKGASIKDLSMFASFPLPLEDRVQAATIGLIRAAKKYKPGRANFSTYAMYWIEHSIQRAVTLDRNIHIPINVIEDIMRKRKAEERLTAELKRKPRSFEINSALLGEVSLFGLVNIEDAEKVENPLRISDLGDAIDEVYDRTQDISHDELIEQITREDAIDKAMNELTQRERDILAMRYGMVGGEPMTLEAVAAEMGFTRERVRQLEVEALKRLRKIMPDPGL